MIHLLWATIRPHLFIQMYKIWMERCKYQNVTTYVAVNSQNDSEIVKSVLGKDDKVIIIKTDRKGVCYPYYMLSSKLEGNNDDIVVFASDDFSPPYNWDSYLLNKLNGREACLMVNDGYQALDFSNMAEPVFSIPIMTYSALVKLNKIIYNPVYSHLCSDAELYLNAKDLNLIFDDRINDKNYIFEHHHWSSGKRQADVNDQVYYSNFENDKKTWEKRKTLSLEERLKV